VQPSKNGVAELPTGNGDSGIKRCLAKFVKSFSEKEEKCVVPQAFDTIRGG
jgi:hypothetical protein